MATASAIPQANRAVGRARTGLWPRVARAMLGIALRVLFRVRLEGEPPGVGPYILVANHQGWVDAFLLVALFPAVPRLVFVGDHKGLVRPWWRRVLLTSLGVVVPINRSARSDRSAIDASLAVLESGGVLGLFPEGRVSRAENELAPFRRGLGYLALRAGVPVLPVWLSGTSELYLGRELTVRVGPSHAPEPGAPTKEATEALAVTLHDRVGALEVPHREASRHAKRWRWLTNLF